MYINCNSKSLKQCLASNCKKQITNPSPFLDNLKLMMNLLKEKARNIQFEAFHVFKVTYFIFFTIIKSHIYHGVECKEIPELI